MRSISTPSVLRYGSAASLVMVALLSVSLLSSSAQASRASRASEPASSDIPSLPLEFPQPSQPASCDALVAAGRQLEREDRDIGPAGEEGRATLCLMRFSDDSLMAILLHVDTQQQFQAAKSDAIGRLRAAGLDLCRIATWHAHGWPVALGIDDYLALPEACAPRVLAADPGASGLVDAVRTSASEITSVLAGQLEWPASWPIRIIVMTDAEAIVNDPPRCWAATVREAADAIRAGRSASLVSSQEGCGPQVLLNLAREHERGFTPDAMLRVARGALVHEYTHVALIAIGGMPVSSLPRWYAEGLAQYLAQFNAGGMELGLLIAAQEQQASRAPRLAELNWPEDWARHERIDGQAAVYTRSYAALVYLIERYGLAAILQPLRDSYGRTPAVFLQALTTATRSELDTLDSAFSAWLAAPGRVLYRDDFSDPLSGWPTGSPIPGVRESYEQGEYAISCATGANSPLVHLSHPLRDFVLEFDVRLAPPTPGAVVAIDLRVQSNGDHYCWMIDLNGGAFALRRVARQDGAELIPLTRSSAIVPGAEWNHLAAHVRGSQIVLYVNDEEVGRAIDATYSEGTVGFSVGSGVGGASGARFDNVVVRNPDLPTAR